MSPVYAVPLAAVVVADLVVSRRRTGGLPVLPGLFVVVVVLLFAGPWWLVSGPAAIHYLVHAGYQPSSGLVTHGPALTPSTIVRRARWELGILGWAESLLLGLGVIASSGILLLRRSAWDARYLWMLAAWSVVTFLALASSDNKGTADGLPILVVLLVGCSAVIGQAAGRWLVPALSLVCIVLIVGAVAVGTSWTDAWFPGPPYRLDAIRAGGTVRTNIDQIAAELAAAIGGGRVVMTVNQPLVTANGLTWNVRDARQVLLVGGSDGARAAVADLDRASFLVTGDSLVDFDPVTDPSRVVHAALRLGYRPVRIWQLGSGGVVVLWQRGARTGLTEASAPSVRVQKPGTGTVVTGSQFLVAGTSPSTLTLEPVASVTFEVSGVSGGQHFSIPAQPFTYGWIAGWKTTTLPDGRYRITAVAVDDAHETARSPVVTVQVGNRPNRGPGSPTGTSVPSTR